VVVAEHGHRTATGVATSAEHGRPGGSDVIGPYDATVADDVVGIEPVATASVPVTKLAWFG
jgi:hypothetical protein